MYYRLNVYYMQLLHFYIFYITSVAFEIWLKCTNIKGELKYFKHISIETWMSCI